MGDNFVHRQTTLFDHPNSDRIATWTQVRAVNVKFFRVADNCPVDCHFLPHHAELYKRPKFANHVQPLLYRARVTCRLNINVAAIAFGEIAYRLDRILFLRIDTNVGTASLGYFEALVAQVESYESFRTLHFRCRHHTQPEWSTTGDHNRILVLDIAAFHGVDGASKRFNEDCVVQRDILGNLIVQGASWKYHVFGPGSEGALSEAIDVMDIAHPISAHLTVATVPARHDLLTDRVISDL